ncbi:MAG: Abi family protein [Chitinophagaceae bacterium]
MVLVFTNLRVAYNHHVLIAASWYLIIIFICVAHLITPCPFGDTAGTLKNKYSNPLPPSWMMLEITSFGSLSILYQNLKPTNSKKDIAHHFGLSDKVFTSWLHYLVYIRNVCAHHSRLWNKGMNITPRIPLTTTKTWLNNSTVPNNRTYFILSMMLYLLQSIDSKHQFIFRFTVHLKKYKNVDVTAMGFPHNWNEESLWNFKPTLSQKLRLAIARFLK